MQPTSHFQVTVQLPEHDCPAPDDTACYTLTIIAAQSTDRVPAVTFAHSGALVAIQTFVFMIDGTALRDGERYQFILDYQVTTDQTQGQRLQWTESFTLQPNVNLVVGKPHRGHGPCPGRTAGCFDW